MLDDLVTAIVAKEDPVDCAAALYVDIVILFIRLLSAGRRR